MEPEPAKESRVQLAGGYIAQLHAAFHEGACEIYGECHGCILVLRQQIRAASTAGPRPTTCDALPCQTLRQMAGHR